MQVHVDAVRSQVRAENRTVHFALDCATDTLSVELDGCEYQLAPLRWRDKRALARYAALGADFVNRQFLRMCLRAPQLLPDDAQAQEILLALARWIGAPGRERVE